MLIRVCKISHFSEIDLFLAIRNSKIKILERIVLNRVLAWNIDTHGLSC